MINLLMKVIVTAALVQFGSDAVHSVQINDRNQSKTFSIATRKALKVNWRPISVFPEEAKRFR